MNARQREYIDQEIDRLITEADGDGWLALRMSVVERLMVSGMVSTGFARVSPVRSAGRVPKPKAPSIDDPKPTDPTASNPGS